MLRENAQLNVCFTGLPSVEERQRLRSWLTDKGIVQDDSLTESTNVLVVWNVITEKYKVASSRRKPIKIVTNTWLEDSIKHNELQPLEKYALDDMFHGAIIGLKGIPQSLVESRYSKLRQHLVRIQGNQQEKKQIYEKLDVIIASQSQQQHFANNFDESTPHVVGMQWLDRCVEAKKCIYPRQYTVNKLQQYHSQYYKFLASQQGSAFINNIISQQLNDPNYNIFQGVVALVFNFNSRMAQRIKTIINGYGGDCLPVFSCSITHVIPEFFTDHDVRTFTKYGDLVSIVTAKWVSDSVVAMRKLDERDYKFRKPKFFIEEARSPTKTNNQNSQPQAFTFGGRENSIGPLDLRRSISHPYQDYGRLKKITQIQSNIFNGKRFYIATRNQKKDEVNEMIRKIKANSGVIYSDPSTKIETIVVLSDSPENPAFLTKYNHCKEKMILASPRWVNYCIEKGEYIDPNKSMFLTFKPFFTSTPVTEFLKQNFIIFGFNQVHKQRIIELLEAVAKRPNQKYLSDITVAICSPELKAALLAPEESKQIVELMEINKKVKYIRLEWIIHSLNEGVIKPIQKYEVDMDSVLQDT